MFGRFCEMADLGRQILSDNVAGIFVLSLLVIIYVYFRNDRKSKNMKLPFPPGPWGFPVVGHLPMLRGNALKTIAKYRNEYGDVFSIQMGSYPAIVLNGIDVIKTAMTKNLEDFSARPKLYTINLLEKQRGQTGITFSEYGPVWKLHRRVSNNVLRMFASYRNNPIEETILSESGKIIQQFLQTKGAAFDPKDEISLAAGSVMYQILFGRQDNIREDKDYCTMIQNLKDFVEFANAGNPIDVMPWTRFILFKKLRRFLNIMSVGSVVRNRQLKKHSESFDPNNIRDVTDALIQASNRLTPEEQKMGLTREKLVIVLSDFLGAGSETVGTTLLWSILHMVTSSEVQARVHAEIDQHIGQSRLPTYKDRKSLPYVEATMLEVLRVGTIAPLAVPHATTCDVELNGYCIPKDTFVLVNLASTCNDEKIWGDPEVFRPDRFLNNGTIDSPKAEMFLSFGAGRRRCLGEFIAKVELFMFFTSLLQRCSFHKVPGEIYNFDASFGLTMKPKPFKIIVKSRNA